IREAVPHLPRCLLSVPPALRLQGVAEGHRPLVRRTRAHVRPLRGVPASEVPAGQEVAGPRKASGVIRVLDAQFITTAVEPKGYPAGHTVEVAFVGRSNVGKSSMINALTGRKKLVRVSNTPGRTRTLNFFDVDLERGTQRHRVRLADLPGYGFAK